MAAFNTQKVLSVHHWTDAYFTFTCTRDDSLRFENGQFVMVGLMVDGKPLMRAYSVASANWEENLEFFSIKVQDGPLTSRLQHLQVGDEVLVSKKPTGTLICGDLNPGKHLYLLSTGTGIAPFLSITKDPDVYEQFEKIILVHGVRYEKDLAYYDRFTKELPEPARDADAASAGIALSAVAGTLTANYQTCHENAVQLRALQEWARGATPAEQ